MDVKEEGLYSISEEEVKDSSDILAKNIIDTLGITCEVLCKENDQFNGHYIIPSIAVQPSNGKEIFVGAITITKDFFHQTNVVKQQCIDSLKDILFGLADGTIGIKELGGDPNVCSDDDQGSIREAVSEQQESDPIVSGAERADDNQTTEEGIGTEDRGSEPTVSQCPDGLVVVPNKAIIPELKQSISYFQNGEKVVDHLFTEEDRYFTKLKEIMHRGANIVGILLEDIDADGFIKINDPSYADDPIELVMCAIEDKFGKQNRSSSVVAASFAACNDLREFLQNVNSIERMADNDEPDTAGNDQD